MPSPLRTKVDTSECVAGCACACMCPHPAQQVLIALCCRKAATSDIVCFLYTVWVLCVSVCVHVCVCGGGVESLFGGWCCSIAFWRCGLAAVSTAESWLERAGRGPPSVCEQVHAGRGEEKVFVALSALWDCRQRCTAAACHMLRATQSGCLLAAFVNPQFDWVLYKIHK